MDPILKNKIYDAYDDENIDGLGDLLIEAGFTSDERNAIYDAYDKEQENIFGDLVSSKQTLGDNPRQQEIDSLRNESNVALAEAEEIRTNLNKPINSPEEMVEYIMINNLNGGKPRDIIMKEIAAFPNLSKAQLMQEPLIKQILMGMGDISTIPGRTIRASVMAPEGEFFETLAETQPTSDGIVGQIGESIAQSPATVPLMMTGVGSIPTLMAVGSAGAIADEAYHSTDDTGVLDYLVSGTVGGLAPAGLMKLGKIIQSRGANFVKKFLVDKGKPFQEAEDMLSAIETRMTKLADENPRIMTKSKPKELKGSEKAARKLFDTLAERKKVLNTKISDLQKSITKSNKKRPDYEDNYLTLQIREELISLIDKAAKLPKKTGKSIVDWGQARLLDLERMYNTTQLSIETLLPTKPISSGLWNVGYQGYENTLGEIPYQQVGNEIYDTLSEGVFGQDKTTTNLNTLAK
tara:strand:+ start:1371 stop:2762 length:1392 start_codon:yes stop_codon:yes gene_type:complete